MIQIKTVQAFEQFRRKINGNIGFVPTMGALHDGHQSLILESLNQCDVTVVSIFVNPTQFSPNEDFDHYPRQNSTDVTLCESLGVTALFMPSEAEIYPNENKVSNYKPNESIAGILCGVSRPHFFYGVCNVVERLFNIIKPTHAFFGEKDLQQRVIIQQMVRDLNVSIQIVSCPIIRDDNGLALSSRNAYLDDDGYKRALNLFKALHDARLKALAADWSSHRIRQFVAAELEGRGLKGDYVAIFRPNDGTLVHGKIQPGDYCCAAVYVDNIRLIDNIQF